jgi:hypothetical protein
VEVHPYTALPQDILLESIKKWVCYIVLHNLTNTDRLHITHFFTLRKINVPVKDIARESITVSQFPDMDYL